MKELDQESLITMGAFNNHIAATTAAAKEHKFNAIGIIRGEELDKSGNPAFHYASEKGDAVAICK